METRFSCSAVLSLSESTLALVPDSSPGISMRIAPVLALRILVFVISSSAKSILLLDKLTISAIVHTYDSPNTTRPYTILVTSNHHGHCSTETLRYTRPRRAPAQAGEAKGPASQSSALYYTRTLHSKTPRESSCIRMKPSSCASFSSSFSC